MTSSAICRHLCVDLETFSSADLPSVGVYKYAAAPDFQVLLFGYSWDGEPVCVIDLTREELPTDIIEALLDDTVIKHAFNAAFERVCLSRTLRDLGLLQKGTFLGSASWRCTMVQTSYYGAAGSLKQVASFLGVDAQKDAAGTRLINKFSKPSAKPVPRAGADWERFIEYCGHDVESEMAVAAKIGRVIPDREQLLYVIDQEINDRGIGVDTELARAARLMSETALKTTAEKLQTLTELDNPNSVAQLKGWLRDRGCAVDSIGKEVLEAEYARADIDPLAKRVIALRLAGAKSSTKKYVVAEDAAGDDQRLRGSFQFYGAATGRWCLTGDHEILSPTGWQRLDEWQGGDIAVWNAQSEAVSFGKANAVSFDYSGPMIELKSKRIAQMSTPDHKMPVWLENGGWTARAVEDMRVREKIPYTGWRINAKPSDTYELRVLIMTQADGHYTRDGALRFHFSRERKIERCKSLLRKARIPFTIESYSDGAVYIGIKGRALPTYLRQFRDKTFGWWMINENAEILFDELEFWDGSRSAKNSIQYTTINKQNADIIQALAHLNGKAVSLLEKNRDIEGWSTAYVLNIWSNPSNRNELRNAKTVTDYSGKVYCAETSTGYFLVRRKGKVWVTGNSGRLMQLQNLPRGDLSGAALDDARVLVKRGEVDMITWLYDNVQDTLKSLIRTVLVPKEGSTFAVSDFSAIEARVLAWLAGETWALDIFKTTGKVYEGTASRMFGVPIERIDKDLRARGKVATLALGYQGGPAALERMGALSMGIPQKELPKIVRMWRNANKRIVGLWGEVEAAAVSALSGEGTQTVARGLVRISRDPGVSGLEITLPSSRTLYYRNAKLDPYTGKLSYEATGKGASALKIDTYGGRLTENITQAIARDILAAAIGRLHSKEFAIVAHVHDEVVVEVPSESAETDLALINDLMATVPKWADGLPLGAEGYTCASYRKG